MKSAMEIALGNVKNHSIQKLEELKKESPDKSVQGMAAPSYYDRPKIYLDSKELSTIGNYKAGDKVVLVVECSVESVTAHDRMEGKEVKKSLNCDLVIEAIADITKA